MGNNGNNLPSNIVFLHLISFTQQNVCITCFEVQKLSFWHRTEGGKSEEEPSRFKRNGSPNLGPSKKRGGSKEVCDSHIFKNFPQFVVIHTVKGFRVVNEVEVYDFLEFPCFFYDPVDVGNLISGPSAFSKSSLSIWKFSVHILLSLA